VKNVARTERSQNCLQSLKYTVRVHWRNQWKRAVDKVLLSTATAPACNWATRRHGRYLCRVAFGCDRPSLWAAAELARIAAGFPRVRSKLAIHFPLVDPSRSFDLIIFQVSSWYNLCVTDMTLLMRRVFCTCPHVVSVNFAFVVSI